MGINMYLTVYRCIRDKFRYQFPIASIGYQYAGWSDRREIVSCSSSGAGCLMEADAVRDLVQMLICCN